MGTFVKSNYLILKYIIIFDSSAEHFVSVGFASDFRGTLNTDDDVEYLANFNAASAINCEFNKRCISGSVDLYAVSPESVGSVSVII